MLELITGKPGNGKTLYMVKRAHEDYVKADTPRPVYYHNIEGVTLDGFHHLEDPNRWMDLPSGSLVIIDEVHKVWPQRTKTEVPAAVQELAEHRHYGIDLLVSTQDPADVDIFVRRRCGRHRHFVRPFEAGYARQWEWQNVQMDPFDHFAQKDGVQHTFKLDSRYFGTYESTAQDTHKAAWPWKKLVPMGVAVAVAVGLVFFVINMILGWSDIAQDDAATDAATAAANSAASAASAAQRAADTVAAIQERFEARIDGLPWSAPFYEAHVKPQTLPIVAGCSHWIIGQQVRCSCTDQNGEPVKLPPNHCQRIMREGFDFDWSGERTEMRHRNAQRVSQRKNGGGLGSGRSGGDGGGGGAPSLGGAPPPNDSGDNGSPFPF